MAVSYTHLDVYKRQIWASHVVPLDPCFLPHLDTSKSLEVTFLRSLDTDTAPAVLAEKQSPAAWLNDEHHKLLATGGFGPPH